MYGVVSDGAGGVPFKMLVHYSPHQTLTLTYNLKPLVLN